MRICNGQGVSEGRGYGCSGFADRGQGNADSSACGNGALDISSVLVVDFGAQYAQLIARRVREARVFSEIVPHTISAHEIIERKPQGIILSGGPQSVYADWAPGMDEAIYELGIPILGICYGAQLIARDLGGRVERTSRGEYGRTVLDIPGTGDISGTGGRLIDSMLAEVGDSHLDVWMSHSDAIVETPPKSIQFAWSANGAVAAFEDSDRGIYGVQFHPEVSHTAGGNALIETFLFDICGASPTWTHTNIIEQSVENIIVQTGEEKVLCALSGGVDSAVAAALVGRAVGDRLICVFVDTGLLRMDEGDQVEDIFAGRMGMNFVRYDAEDIFYEKLAGLTDPEEKRKIIGETFIRIFEEVAGSVGKPRFLVQGTLYPDVIESGGSNGGGASIIKSHHNVGGLPDSMSFELVEPLRMLFKDEVRAVGAELGLPDEILWRQPFPGPGLAVRIIGEVTRERTEILRAAEAILDQEIKKAGLYRELWQSFAVLPAVRTVGVMGDQRTYAYPVVIRAVTSDDAMTADWARLPYDLVEKISARMIGEVDGVNRVVLDVTSKPPGTIEWE